jgi:predicted enzyme related to lactoylglutathione lyase
MDETREKVSTILFVDNYDKAIDFYCNLSGLFSVYVDSKINDNYRYIILTYHRAECPFDLMLEKPSTELENMLIGKQGGEGNYLSLPVKNIEELSVNLIEKGVEFKHEITELPYATLATIIDPFGNTIGLVDSFTK